MRTALLVAASALAAAAASPATAQTAPEAFGFMMTFASERLAPGTKLVSATADQAKGTYDGKGHRQTIVATRKTACLYELDVAQVGEPGSNHSNYTTQVSVDLTNADWMKASTKSNSLVGRYVEVPGAKLCFLNDRAHLGGYMAPAKDSCGDMRTIVPIEHVMTAYQILSQTCKPRAF